jgi:anti-sigma B factor antagonist
MAPSGSLRMRRQAECITFQVEGWATMRHSLPLRRAAEQALARGVRAIHVDLTPCAYMDSTFLGTLLFLRRAAERASSSFALVGLSPACEQLMQQMGLADVFPVQAETSPAAGCWDEVPLGQDDPEAFNRNVARAHEELARVPGQAGATFQRVAQCLAKDLPPDQDATIEIVMPKKK